MSQQIDMSTIAQLFYRPLWSVALVTGRWSGRASADIAEHEERYWRIVSSIHALNAHDSVCRQVWALAFRQGYEQGQESPAPAELTQHS